MFYSKSLDSVSLSTMFLSSEGEGGGNVRAHIYGLLRVTPFGPQATCPQLFLSPQATCPRLSLSPWTTVKFTKYYG